MYEKLDLSGKLDKKLLREIDDEDREQLGNTAAMGTGE
jgi:hypothetical protein